MASAPLKHIPAVARLGQLVWFSEADGLGPIEAPVRREAGRAFCGFPRPMASAPLKRGKAGHGHPRLRSFPRPMASAPLKPCWSTGLDRPPAGFPRPMASAPLKLFEGRPSRRHCRRFSEADGLGPIEAVPEAMSTRCHGRFSEADGLGPIEACSTGSPGGCRTGRFPRPMASAPLKLVRRAQGGDGVHVFRGRWPRPH